MSQYFVPKGPLPTCGTGPAMILPGGCVPPKYKPGYPNKDKKKRIYQKGQRVEFWNSDNCPDIAGLQPGHPCMNLVIGIIHAVDRAGDFYQIVMETDGGSGTLVKGIPASYITKTVDNWDGELLVNKPIPLPTQPITKTQTAGMGGTNMVMLLVVGGFLFYAYNKGLLK